MSELKRTVCTACRGSGRASADTENTRRCPGCAGNGFIDRALSPLPYTINDFPAFNNPEVESPTPVAFVRGPRPGTFGPQ